MARWRYKYEHSETLSQSIKAAWSEPEIIGRKGGYVTALGRPAVFVLTGGPGGGKTTFMGELRNEDPNCRKWVLVPEAAPWLFRAGLNASEKSFQAGVVHLQIALEDACAQAAPCEAVLLCHRGSLDPLAYWLAAGWNEKDFFDCVGFSRDALLQRYAGIIHLQTAALDAEDHYLGWPDAHRRETPAEARTIDGLCRRAWNGHHRQTFIENHGRNWAGKSHVLRQTLSCWLSDSQTE